MLQAVVLGVAAVAIIGGMGAVAEVPVKNIGTLKRRGAAELAAAGVMDLATMRGKFSDGRIAVSSSMEDATEGLRD